MRNERRYYNKKKIRSSQKRQCLRCWFFCGLFCYEMKGLVIGKFANILMILRYDDRRVVDVEY